MKQWMRLLAVLGVLAGMLTIAVPVGADEITALFFYRTWATVNHPGQYSDETIWVEACVDPDCNYPADGAPVHTVWNYRTTTSYLDWHTGSDGRAAMTRNIGDATCGFTVRVDIYVYDGDQIDSAYFTPCGDAAASPSYAPAHPTFQGPVSGSNYDCPAGYPVKANSNSGIYHQPWQQYYAATNARNCYASAAAAEADGYRASKV